MADAGTPAGSGDALVVDASVLVDLLAGGLSPARLDDATAGYELLAPSHLDAEVLSALGRLARAGTLPDAAVAAGLAALARLPVQRAPLPPLLAGAWRRRAQVRLADALYLELAARHGCRVLTVDARLARASPAARLLDG